MRKTREKQERGAGRKDGSKTEREELLKRREKKGKRRRRKMERWSCQRKGGEKNRLGDEKKRRDKGLYIIQGKEEEWRKLNEERRGEEEA